MLLPVYIALFVALSFYIVLPVIGGYLSRGQWRRFRERLIELHRAPLLRLDTWATVTEPEARWLGGARRLMGTMEAIEGEDRIWIRGEGLTASVDLRRSFFYILAGRDGEADPQHPRLVERLAWSRVRVFPEGAKVFVGGPVRIESGKAVFCEAPGQSLLVVSYEGEEASLLPRLIAGGRRDNEYWNALSRVSIALGFGVMTIFISLIWTAGYFPTVIFLSLVITLLPVLALLPPGLAFFFLYLHFWKQGLENRTKRDLLRLSATREGGDVSLHAERESRRMDRLAWQATFASGLSLALGLVLNFVLAFVLWRFL